MKKNKIMRASKLLWMLLSFLIIGVQSFSQTSTRKITGKIINKTTREPILPLMLTPAKLSSLVLRALLHKVLM
jgi:hypothetical protein